MIIKTEQDIDNDAVLHANKVSAPEFPEWHGRYSSFKAGANWMQSDLLEQFKKEEECWLITVNERDERIKELEEKYEEAIKDIQNLSNTLIEAFSYVEPEYCCNGYMCECLGKPIDHGYDWKKLGEVTKSKYGLDKQERES